MQTRSNGTTRGLLNTFLPKLNYTQQVDNYFVTYAIYRGVKCLNAGAGYLKNLPLPRLGPGLRLVQRGSAVPLLNKNPRRVLLGNSFTVLRAAVTVSFVVRYWHQRPAISRLSRLERGQAGSLQG